MLSGGRYDDLLKKVGRDMPAIGFGVKVDYLLDAVNKLEYIESDDFYMEYPGDDSDLYDHRR